MDSESELKSFHLDRISFLAQPKESKTVWATTPWILTWGNQESIRPLSRSALQANPSPRIKALAQPKRDFSLQIQLRKEEEEEEERRRMKISRPSSHAVQYESIVRLATPKTRGRSPQEVSYAHSFLCEHDCPIWHVGPSVRNVVISPRILQLADPKTNHPNFTSNRQNVQTFISYAAQTAKMTSRLEQLSLPKLRENRHFYNPGRPESPIRTVSRGARNATASARIQALSTPKALSKDYIPPREPTWQP
ncbi:testicular haploid expressed gene protein-like [Sinocyclocheilus rhinocerous]|uniref:testicular haploid expressed gene protein-like n=1 Tax=Sinocyclocheilus rhinocerous TaxID=307959 RepID=UPI0007BA5363|nr:PREDICTED: testicular haploid expressed gene protein-like [Sinocyclocheilus rhinocerous]